MYQAGINRITLYENKSLNFEFWNSFDNNAITNITNEGEIIVVENNQQPEYEIIINKFEREITFDLNLKFLLMGLLNSNIDLHRQLSNSIYGWCALIEFYDGEIRFYNVPLTMSKSGIKPQTEMIFEIILKNDVEFTESYFDYTANVSIAQTFRSDTTYLTCDSDLITSDYEF